MMHQFIEFAESVKALAATTTNLTPEQINALSVLDPEFRENAEKLYNVFSVLFTTPIVEEAVEMVAEAESGPTIKKTTKKKTLKKTSKKKTPPTKDIGDKIVYEPTNVPDGFFIHPCYGHICANKAGEIIISNKKVIPHMNGGYLRVNIGGGKYVTAARLVYECCTGKLIKGKTCIKYKNDKHDDVRFDNLYVTEHRGGYGSFSDSEVVRISEKIVYYANQNIPTNQIARKIVNDLSVSITGVKSILAGNYSKISGKYFYVGPGKKIIPVVQTKEETNQKPIIDPCQAVLEKGLEAGVECFDAKFLSGEKITNGDLIVPIVRFMYNEDGSMSSTATIKDKIRSEYGSDIIPSDKLIMDVKEKRLGKAVIEAALKK